MLERLKLLMFMHPQVYVDISAINYMLPRKEFHNYLEQLVNAGFGKRIMFGSDAPIWPEAIEQGILAIDEADFLSEQQKQDIFYHNAMRFFRMSEKDLKK